MNSTRMTDLDLDGIDGGGGNLLHQSELESMNDEEDSHDPELEVAFVENRRPTYGRPSMGIILWRSRVFFIPLVLVAVVVGFIFGPGFGGGDGDGNSSTGGKNYIPPVPANLEAVCDTNSFGSSSDGDLACREQCEPAECCHFPSTFALSCLQGNEETCMTYHASCQVIEDFGPKNAVTLEDTSVVAPPAGIPPAPALLDQACAMTNIATIDGFADCQTQCDRAKCCYEGGCPDEKDACQAYAPCLHLGATDHFNSKIKPYLEMEACSDLTTVNGRTHCRLACQHSLCCFDDTKTCPHADGDSFCDQYAICNSLESQQTVEASAEEITAACGRDLNTYPHESLCEIECERGACCYTEDGCGSGSGNVDCAQTYAPCAFLYGDNGSSTGGGGGDDDSGVILKIDVDAACIGVDPAKLLPIDHCYKFCMPAQCCFDASAACTEEVRSSCHVYESCVILFEDEDDDEDDDDEEGEDNNGGGGGQPSPPTPVPTPPPVEHADDLNKKKDDIDHACAGSFGAQNPECAELCLGSSCCFDGSSCEAGVSCRVFSSCSIIYGKQVDVEDKSAIKKEVDDACLNQDPKEVDRDFSHPCHKICEESSCCFDDAFDCTHEIADCAAYQACQGILFDNASYQSAVAAATDAEAARIDNDNDGKMDIVGFTKEDVESMCQSNDMLCREMCISAKCCYDQEMQCQSGVLCNAWDSCMKYYGNDPNIGPGGGDIGDFETPTVPSDNGMN